MTTATVTSHQSLFDVAVEHCGTMEDAMLIAFLNGRSLTDDLVNGEELTIGEPSDTATVQTFAVNRYKPASAITQDQILEVLGQDEGIEFWGIEFDFIVSAETGTVS
ncbi:MAG: hypothetical protein IJ838_00040 [Paludibacteraceae bacterium]|nr:hypothetical protein [Paludibacteraceae bacterium]